MLTHHPGCSDVRWSEEHGDKTVRRIDGNPDPQIQTGQVVGINAKNKNSPKLVSAFAPWQIYSGVQENCMSAQVALQEKAGTVGRWVKPPTQNQENGKKKNNRRKGGEPFPHHKKPLA